MKSTVLQFLLPLWLVTVSSVTSGWGQSSVFTYQGRLMDQGQPAAGEYEMAFTLLDANAAQSVAPSSTNIVSVQQGQFTVTLPGSPAVFSGARRFLQIAVRPKGSPAPFVTLLPAQEIQPAPYALRAAVASSADTAISPAIQSVGPEHIRASGTPGPGRVLLNSGTTWVWTNLPAAAAAWQLAGNAGTSLGTNFLGTTDSAPLELRVNSTRALRLDSGAGLAPNVIAGSASNHAIDALDGAAIAGGGNPTSPNVVSGNFGSVGGGAGNSAATFAVVSGGEGNAGGGDHATISGGFFNTILADTDHYFGGTVPASSAVVGGGEQNDIRSVYSVIGGGSLNAIAPAAGDSIIGGGYQNFIDSGAYFASLLGGSGNDIGRGAEFSVLGGGENNSIASNAMNAVVTGGLDNVAAGSFATISGGLHNRALGSASVASGRSAQANHAGTFVWSDGTAASFASTASNQFLVRATGGVGIGTNNPQATLHVAGTALADQFRGRHAGDGSGLTNLPVAPVNPNTAYLNSNQVFVGAQTFAPAAGAPFAVGNSTRVANLNADLLDGLDSTAFAAANHTHDASSIVSGQIVRTVNGLFGNVAVTAGANITLATNGNGLTIAAPTGGPVTNAWKIGGNAGTSSSNFLGTTDSQPLEFRVANGRVQRFESVGISPSIIGGYSGNAVSNGAIGAFIGGGGRSENINLVSGNFGTISGGEKNSARGTDSTVGGGFSNLASNTAAVVGGGWFNSAAGIASTIGGGYYNVAQTNFGTVAGGSTNYAYGPFSTVGGGSLNIGADDFAFVGGGFFNLASNYATVSGGSFNRAHGDYSTVGGGYANQATGYGSVIGGGGGFNPEIGQYGFNTSSGYFTTVAGGIGNVAGGAYSVVGGGVQNTSIVYAATVAGGLLNSATNTGATVLGGQRNLAGGTYSLAAGSQAKALHSGSFVWADASGGDLVTTANNQFLVRANGGVGINTNNPTGASLFVAGNRAGGWGSSVAYIQNNNTSASASPALRVTAFGNTFDGALSVSAGGSGLIARFGNAFNWVADITTNGTMDALAFNPTSDRNAKENFRQVRPDEVLRKVAALPISEWNFKVAPGEQHVGPMAQDFRAAFGLGSDDRHIATVDADGVAFAAIQGLNAKVDTKVQSVDAEVATLRQQNEALQSRVAELEKLVHQLLPGEPRTQTR